MACRTADTRSTPLYAAEGRIFIFKFAYFRHARCERRSPLCDQSATHPSQKAAKDGAPTFRTVSRRKAGAYARYPTFRAGRGGDYALARDHGRQGAAPGRGKILKINPILQELRQHRGPLLKKREKWRTPSWLVPTIKGNPR